MIHRRPTWTTIAIAVGFATAAGVLPSQGAITLTTVADTYVRGGTNVATNYNTSTALEWSTNDATTASRRLTYMKFDLSSVTAADIESVTLNMVNSYTATTGSQTMHFYGINQSANLDGWAEGTLTANSLVALTSAANVTLNLSVLTNLGTLVTDQDVLLGGSPISFSSAALTSFLIANSGGDKLVSILIARDAGNTSIPGIRSKENGDGSFAPALVVTVPEPDAALLGGLGLLALFRRRR